MKNVRIYVRPARTANRSQFSIEPYLRKIVWIDESLKNSIVKLQKRRGWPYYLNGSNFVHVNYRHFSYVTISRRVNACTAIAPKITTAQPMTLYQRKPIPLNARVAKIAASPSNTPLNAAVAPIRGK